MYVAGLLLHGDLRDTRQGSAHLLAELELAQTETDRRRLAGTLAVGPSVAHKGSGFFIPKWSLYSQARLGGWSQAHDSPWALGLELGLELEHYWVATDTDYLYDGAESLGVHDWRGVIQLSLRWTPGAK